MSQTPVNPERGVLDVGVILNEPVVTEEEAAKALERAGMVTVDKGLLCDLNTVGAHIHGAGLLRMQRGRIMVSQQRLDQASRMIFNLMSDVAAQKSMRGKVNSLTRLAQTLGYLSSKMTETQELMLQFDGGRKNLPLGNAEEPTAVPFARGSIVRPSSTTILAQHVHMDTPKSP